MRSSTISSTSSGTSTSLSSSRTSAPSAAPSRALRPRRTPPANPPAPLLPSLRSAQRPRTLSRSLRMRPLVSLLSGKLASTQGRMRSRCSGDAEGVRWASVLRREDLSDGFVRADDVGESSGVEAMRKSARREEQSDLEYKCQSMVNRRKLREQVRLLTGRRSARGEQRHPRPPSPFHPRRRAVQCYPAWQWFPRHRRSRDQMGSSRRARARRGEYSGVPRMSAGGSSHAVSDERGRAGAEGRGEMGERRILRTTRVQISKAKSENEVKKKGDTHGSPSSLGP